MAKINEEPIVTPFFFEHEGRECVEVRIAGERNFRPIFPVDSLWERQGNLELTYADRWPDEYAAFKAGEQQVANGTDLNMVPGLGPDRIAELRALNIYTVESLAAIDGRNIKALGGNGYKLKQLAEEFLTKRPQFVPNEELEALRARIAELEAQKTATAPAWDKTGSEMAGPSDDQRTDEELKQAIAAKTGKRPQGNPNRGSLLSMLRDLEDVAA
jgi:hypothetical protein